MKVIDRLIFTFVVGVWSANGYSMSLGLENAVLSSDVISVGAVNKSDSGKDLGYTFTVKKSYQSGEELGGSFPIKTAVQDELEVFSSILGQDVILLGVRGEENDASVYIYPPLESALLLNIRPLADQIENLVSEINTHSNFSGNYSGCKDSDGKKAVFNFIQSLKNGERYNEALNELESIGEKTVPYLIEKLRTFDQINATIEVFSQSFESKRYYRPEVVSDAVNIALEVITGKSFAFTHNGARKSVRMRAANSWNYYLWKHKEDFLKACE